MPSYKLVYFNGRGRAEVARLLFAASGTKFEDARLQGEEWQKYKPQTPFGQLPVLEVDGKMIGQSIAVNNFIAREVGLYGKDNFEAAKIDQIVQTVSDLTSEVIKFMFEKDEAKKAELQKKFAEEIIPKYLTNFTKLLKVGDGYFLGSKLTLADIAVFDGLHGLEARQPGMLSPFPELKSYVDKIANIPNIKKWLTERPATNF